jgi:flagellin-like protein
MNLRNPYIALLPSLAVVLSGCAAIGDIFKAGAWTGIIGVIVLLAIVFAVARMFTGRGA